MGKTPGFKHLTDPFVSTTPYNLLPRRIKLLYRIIYSELVSDDLTIFKNSSGKWGVLKKEQKWGFTSWYTCIVKPRYHSVGYNKQLEMIEAVEIVNNEWDSTTNIFYYYNTSGKLLRQLEKGTSANIDQHGNIIRKKNGLYGLFDTNFNVLIEPQYEQLRAIDNTYFIASKNQLFGIISVTDQPILEFAYTEIFDKTINNRVIVVKNSTYFSFDLINQTLESLPFDQVLRPTSNTYGAPTRNSLSLFKAISDCTKKEDMEEEDMAKYRGKWGIIEADGSIKIPLEYDYIDFLRNPRFFKVCKGNLVVNDWEDVESDYRLNVSGDAKWGIVDAENNSIVPIEYDWIDEVESTIWVVYKGGQVYYNDDYQENYWTIKGGKLGVYNGKQLITPIEYASIDKNWFRVKDYIFVRKEDHPADYDVYTFDGKKIEANKPNPRDHVYYGG